MRNKREFWQTIMMAAIMSGRQNVSQATTTADEAVAAYEFRAQQWDADEASEAERKGF